MLVAGEVRYRFRGLKWRTAESTGGGGMKPGWLLRRRSAQPGPCPAEARPPRVNFPNANLLSRSGRGDRERM
jgi:hypothetical protein